MLEAAEQEQTAAATNGVAREDATFVRNAGSVYAETLQPLVEKYDLSSAAIEKISQKVVDLGAMFIGYCAIADQADNELPILEQLLDELGLNEEKEQ